MKYDLEILKKYVDKKLLHVQFHPELPLRIYKYSQNCVFTRAWDNITLNMRGTVIDEKGNLISNPLPKFFNMEELEPMGISLPHLPYRVYDKVDGSFISVFRYEGKIVVSSMGSFTSPHAIVAEKMLYDKYAHLLEYIEDGKTYLFELITPENKIVVDFGDEKKLELFAIRNTEDGSEKLDALDSAKKLGFDVVEEIDMPLEELKDEALRPDFINKEGFVIVFENGFRVKVKYAEYFRLHKIISNVNETFVWEFLSMGKPLELDNIPDETFQFIKDTKKLLENKFEEKWNEINKVYSDTIDELDKKYGKGKWLKKDFALIVLPKYKKISGGIFHLYENRHSAVKDFIWKMLKPKYEKGQSGFQSMKI